MSRPTGSLMMMNITGTVNGMFSLTDIYGCQDVRDYAYSWQADFRDDVEGYLDYNITGFKYVDGLNFC